MDKTCENCRYRGGGLCRRNPPMMAGMAGERGGNYFSAVWPEVAPDDWCGEWNYIPLPPSPMEVE